MPFSVKIKNAGKIQEIELDDSSTGLDFKRLIEQKTQIPVSRQKILIKGGKLTDDVIILSMKFNTRLPIMVLGTPGNSSLPADVPKVVFLEDMNEGKIAKVSQDPSGLVNLGNTCYLNSSLQAIYSMTDVRKQLEASSHLTNPLAKALKALYVSMSKKTENVVPTLTLMHFRSQFPQFAEQEMGVYKQQDAEEAFSQLLASLGTSIDVESLFMLTFKVATKDPVSGETTDTSEMAFKLNCYIDIKTNFVRDGILNGLKDSVEKYNESLQSNTEYQVTKTITRLPKYLTLHFVRFFWRKDTKKKSKILRKVTFPFELDVAEMLDDSIKTEKVQIRDQLRRIEKDNLELERELKKMKKDNSLTPHQQKIEEEAKIDSIKSRFRDDYRDILPPEVDLEKTTENPSSLYELTAVVTHQGISADSGHYQAFVRDVKDSETWWKFNDNKVTSVSKEKIEGLAGGGESDSALILIYTAKGL